MTCPIELAEAPNTTVSFKSDHTVGKDFASVVPVVVVKKPYGQDKEQYALPHQKPGWTPKPTTGR